MLSVQFQTQQVFTGSEGALINSFFYLYMQIVTLAVFILENALSVQTDNASMAVFILRTDYPTGRTWAKI